MHGIFASWQCAAVKTLFSSESVEEKMFCHAEADKSVTDTITFQQIFHSYGSTVQDFAVAAAVAGRGFWVTLNLLKSAHTL